MKIFLSYSSQNRARVEPVNFALAAQGHDVFLDRDDLPSGAWTRVLDHLDRVVVS